MYLPKNTGRRTAVAVFLGPSVIGMVVFCLIPIVSSLVFSLMDYDLVGGTMNFIGLKNFTRILGGSEFPKVVKHTLTYLVLYLPMILIAIYNSSNEMILKFLWRIFRFAFCDTLYSPTRCTVRVCFPLYISRGPHAHTH